MDRLKDAKVIAAVFNMFEEGSAKIVGGFLRDIVLLREPKDIDILIEHTSKQDYREVELLADRLGYTLTDYSSGYQVSESEHLRFVVNLTKQGSLPIDLIFINCTVKERMKEFPCGLSQIWLDGNNIVQEEAFKYGRANETLVFLPIVSDEYKDRMRSYFPTYKTEIYAK